MSTYYEVRFTGNLKLNRDIEFTNRIRNWLMNSKILKDVEEDSTEFDECPDDGYFKFEDSDFLEDGYADDFLKALRNSDDFEFNNDIFHPVGYFTNQFTEDLKFIVEEKEDDIIYISVCIGNKNRNDNIYFLIYLLWNYAENNFTVVVDSDKDGLLTIIKNNNNLLPEHIIKKEHSYLSHTQILECIGLSFKSYEDLEKSYCKEMYSDLITEQDYYKQYQ